MDAILSSIPSLSLPLTPALRSSNAFTHSSLYGTKHQTFEEPDGEMIKDYERLEVRSPSLCAEVGGADNVQFLGDAVLK